MAKPMLVTLPFVLLLLDYWPLRRWKNPGALLIEKIPFFVLSAASCVVTFVVQQRGGAVSGMTVLSLGQRVCNVFVSYARYLQKTFWPVHLSVLYPHPRTWPAWVVAGSIVLLTLISAGVWRQRTRQPFLLTGWFWFLGMLVPVIGLVQVGIQSMADRYSYVPQIGVLIMVVWGAYEWLGRTGAGRRVLAVSGALALAACAVLTPRQTRYWTR